MCVSIIKMGIKSLKKFIKEHFVQFSLSQGDTVCVDSSILMYKYRYIYDTDNFHIIGFINKVIEFLEQGVIPIFVFDGKPPEAKKETLKKRSETRNSMISKVKKLKEQVSEEFISDGEVDVENVIEKVTYIQKIEKNILIVTKNHYLEVVELLKSLGIPVYQSEGEAEQTCAFLQKNGYANYVITEDTDSLTFGGTKILFKENNGYLLCRLENVLTNLGIDYLQFVDFCILCGCDYIPGIHKIGPVTALKIIKKGNIEHFISENKKYTIPDSFNYQLARDIFTQELIITTNDFTVKKTNYTLATEILLKNKLDPEYYLNKNCFK